MIDSETRHQAAIALRRFLAGDTINDDYESEYPLLDVKGGVKLGKWGGAKVGQMDFTEPIIRGVSLFHCHLLSHEDKGMMARIFFK